MRNIRVSNLKITENAHWSYYYCRQDEGEELIL